MLDTTKILNSDLFKKIPEDFDNSKPEFQKEVYQALQDLERIERTARIHKQKLQILAIRKGYQTPSEIL